MKKYLRGLYRVFEFAMRYSRQVGSGAYAGGLTDAEKAARAKAEAEAQKQK